MNYFLKKDDFKDKTIFWDIDGTLAPYRFNVYCTDQKIMEGSD